MLLGYSSKHPKELAEIRDRIIELESDWGEFAESEYYMIIDNLRESQVDKISNGLSYNQTEIIRHLKKLK